MDPIAPLIDRLNADGRPRVWSLVITVFGDSVEPRGGRVSSARLGRLLGRVGIEPGALRTALSRLGRDGWVESQRDGRLSHFRLTASGRAHFTEATHRIYAAPTLTSATDWVLSLDAQDDPFALHVSGLTLRPASNTKPDAELRLTGLLELSSPQAAERLISQEHKAALSVLLADIDTLSQTPPTTPLDAAAARVLLIHRWRRVVLRFPELVAPVLPTDWKGLSPRARVADCWHNLTPLAETWWGDDASDLPPLPEPNLARDKRFVTKRLD